MKRIKLLALSLALAGGFAAGTLVAPPAEAASKCFYDGCNWCCWHPNGSLVCTQRACV